MTPTFRLAPLAELHEDPKNARRHGKENRAVVRSSLAEFGQVEALVVERGTGLVIGGNCRLQELRDLGRTEAWIAEVDVHGPKAKRLALVLNRSAELAEWNFSTLSDAMRELEAAAEGLAGIEGLGWDNDELEKLLGHKPGGGLVVDPDADLEPAPGPNLADRFGVPPFSVLDARQGYWQERKRAWLAIGIQSELGRGASETGIPGGSRLPPATVGDDGRTQRGDGRGRVAGGGVDARTPSPAEAGSPMTAAVPHG